MKPVVELRQGSGAMSAEEVNRRDPFVGLRMGDVETARGEHCDGGIDVGVSHERRVEELNHAIDSPRYRVREWRRTLRQLFRLRRKRRRFFIKFLRAGRACKFGRILHTRDILRAVRVPFCAAFCCRCDFCRRLEQLFLFFA